MSYENILVETRGRVGLVTLNRPKALNAINARLVVELETALAELDADDAIAAMVITGSEKAFAAGADIKEMVGKDFMEALRSDFIASSQPPPSA